jgi:hypothetical protein
MFLFFYFLLSTWFKNLKFKKELKSEIHLAEDGILLTDEQLAVIENMDDENHEYFDCPECGKLKSRELTKYKNFDLIDVYQKIKYCGCNKNRIY